MSSGIVKAGCGVIIFNSNGDFLLMKRKSKHGNGTYAICGGGIEFGESLETAVAREAKEELGIELENIKPIGITNNIIKEENHHSIAPIMAATIKNNDEPKNMEPDKCEEFLWCNDWDNLPKPIFTTYTKYITKQMLQNYFASVKNNIAL